MIARAAVDALRDRPPTPDSPLLSVYLDVDQSRAVNLNRGFVAALKARVRTLEHGLADETRDALRADAERVVRFLRDYAPHARTLVAFADDSAGFFWTGELGVALPTDVRWEPAAWVRPLLEALDEHERHAVVLADKTRARIFTVFLGEIEEERTAFAAAETRRKNASGTDHLRSQMHFQRRDEMHVQWHLREVADIVEDMAASSRRSGCPPTRPPTPCSARRSPPRRAPSARPSRGGSPTCSSAARSGSTRRSSRCRRAGYARCCTPPGSSRAAANVRVAARSSRTAVAGRRVVTARRSSCRSTT
jgi:hypothetical protein